MAVSESRGARAGSDDGHGDRPRILVVNTGSSSVKLALFVSGPPVRRIGATEVERLIDAGGYQQGFRQALDALVPDLEGGVDAIGHRIVHGGRTFTSPVLLSPPVLARLRELESLAP